MRKKLLLLSVLVIAFISPAWAQVTTQTVHIVSATVDGQQDGATGISTDAAVDVSFTFDQALPSASAADFFFEYIGEVADGSEPTLSTDKKTITFALQHKADTDYYWIASGSTFTDTTFQTLIQVAPYVLAYTTSDGSDRFSVSGTVSTSSGASKNLVDHKPVMIRGLHRAASLYQSASPSGLTASKAKNAPSNLAKATAPSFASAAAVDAEGSIVWLLQADNPNPDVSSGQVVGAAIAGSGGSYTVDFAQAGTYYAVAQNIGGLDVTDLSGLFGVFFDLYIGSHDTNSDGAPDDVTVAASDVSGANITMYPASQFAVTSVDADADARAFAETQVGTSDLTLLSVTAIGNETNGEASFWDFEYLYHDAVVDADMVVTVTREAFLIYTYGNPSHASGEEVALPTDYPTTPELLTTLAGNTEVGGFLSAHNAAPKLVWLSAGVDLLSADPVGIINSDKILWRAAILSAGETFDFFSEDAVVAYLDMATDGVVNVQTYPALESDYVDLATEAAPLVLGGTGSSLYNVSATGVNPLTGTAFGWTYTYVSTVPVGGDYTTSVSLNALFPFVFPIPFTDKPAVLPLVPEEHATAASVLASSEANGGLNFRNGHADDAYVDIEGGYATRLLFDRPDLVTAHPDIETTPVWAVTYAEFKDLGEAEVDSLVYVYDMVSGDLITRVGVATGNEQEGELPRTASLQGSYPNPFRAQAHIPFALPSAQHVTLKVYNVLGQEVAVLVDGVIPAGNQSVTWNATAVPSGVYFVQMKSDGATLSEKLIVQH